jgi:hypothetical protein
MPTRAGDVRQFIRRARKAGVVITGPDGSGHWAVIHEGHRCSTIAGSPSDHRWLKNAVADIRRFTGIDLRPEHQKRKPATQ